MNVHLYSALVKIVTRNKSGIIKHIKKYKMPKYGLYNTQNSKTNNVNIL